MDVSNKVQSLLIVTLIVFIMYLYVYRMQPCVNVDKTETISSKMQASAVNGLIRGCISGYILGGPEYAILSGATMCLINPLMVCLEHFHNA